MGADPASDDRRRLQHWPAPVIAAALLLGFSFGIFSVWRQSEAAFSSSTGNGSSSFGLATVTLGDDDTGSALFDATAGPGQTGSACLTVTYTGTVSSPIKLYATAASDDDALGAEVALKIEEGTGGTFAGGCAGFSASGTVYDDTLGAFLTSSTDYSSGVGSWTADPVSSTTRSYKFTWTLDAGASSSLGGKSVEGTFVWESRA